MALYAVSEGVAAALGMQLWTMSRRGEDLSQAGLTAYMFDVIYITWFVHITTALLSRYFWWTFALIPMYALYLFYAKILEPFVLRGRRMNRTAVAAPSKQATDSTTEPGLSKRQAKLQARQKRGTRVQMRRG
ncbi:hypothetical protein Malapachy_0256 [Malassezia pachydermatis]|uniref:Uncharacterized protein n=1 Tax=Malassezia pachydermatis TaxID=77020 RepID=A0A0M8MSA8_9BASI|nr:hypothetical protein Malapachy_0256 [Malassezia pachydermatis]KOS13334.1 hypothetical protein Malapachy_0256 [Malassezia pachydermatis]